MRHKRVINIFLMLAAVILLSGHAGAADYTFQTTAPRDYYVSTSYEDVYGSAYHYGGQNVSDYQAPELRFGSQSTTQTGVMERTQLPGLQQTMASGNESYGITAPVTVPDTSSSLSYLHPAYTSADGMERKDGSIGTVQIPTLGISMKLWEGETAASMSKGMAHYSATSAWNGNVGVCGHNRGSKYVIGSIKDLKIGDVITYTTIYGTRTYEVSMVRKISNTDWSYLQSTSDNRITLTTCVENDPSQRWCVQATEICS